MQWLKWNSNVFGCFMRDVVLELRPQSIEGPGLLYLNNWVSSVQLLSIQRLRNWVSSLKHYHCPQGGGGRKVEWDRNEEKTNIKHTNYWPGTMRQRVHVLALQKTAALASHLTHELSNKRSWDLKFILRKYFLLKVLLKFNFFWQASIQT